MRSGISACPINEALNRDSSKADSSKDLILPIDTSLAALMGIASKSKGFTYHSMLDDSSCGSFVQTHVLSLRSNILHILNLLEILLDPLYFRVDGMFFGINTIEPQVSFFGQYWN